MEIYESYEYIYRVLKPGVWLFSGLRILVCLLFIIQVMEWYVMNNLLEEQKGKTVEEIYTANNGGYINVRKQTKAIKYT